MHIKKLLADQVLIDPEIIPETKTTSGIIINKEPEMGDAFIGTVVAIGPGRVVAGVGVVDVDVNVGDKVMFRYGKPLVIEGKTYSLVLESDCILII